MIMAAYNCRAHIDRAIDSLRAQTLASWELIVVDDASSDDTVDQVLRIAAIDPRVRLETRAINGGPAAARNTGLAAARGGWIGVIDADDAMRPTRLARLLTLAEEHGADMVADNLTIYDHHAAVETGTAMPTGGAVRAVTAADLLFSEGSRQLSLGFIKPLMRRSLFGDGAAAYDPSLRYAEDFMLYADLLLSGAKAVLTPEPLYVYTTQVGAVSGRRSPHSHTRFAPEIRPAIAEHLWERHGQGLSLDNRKALVAYTAYVRSSRWAHAMSEAKNARRFAAMVGLMARHPRAAGRFILAQRPLRLLFGGRL